MVKNSRVMRQGYSQDWSPSQGSHEMHKVASQPTTRGRKSQRYLREQEAEREMELGRQRILEETKLLQKTKNLGGARIDTISQAGSQLVKKC